MFMYQQQEQKQCNVVNKLEQLARNCQEFHINEITLNNVGDKVGKLEKKINIYELAVSVIK